MRVAVISNHETQCGRTSFMMLLSSVFTRSQHRRAALFSTGTMKDLFNIATPLDDNMELKSAEILKSMIMNGTVRESELYDYALRLSEDEVFAFDVFTDAVDRTELQSMFIAMFRKLQADLVLIEIVGGISEPFNTEVIRNSDAVLNVFNHDLKSIEGVVNYVKNADALLLRKTGFVCQKFDANSISEKRLSSLIGVPQKNLLQIPYNSAIAKECINGTLNTVGKYIVAGHSEVLPLRMKIQEVMQFLYDSPRYKYIRGINTWYR